MDRDKIFIEEIKEFCQKVVHFTADASYEDFTRDEKLQLAVLKLIENIGEASRRLSAEARARYPNIDWSKAVAMRNRLVHDYMDVDLEIVYDVATREVPLLLKDLAS